MSSSFLLRTVSCLVLILSRAAFAQSPALPPTPIPTQIPGQNAILMGTDWYPEQWPESRWEEDLRLMEAADLKVVRLAEFAWSRMEPSEGKYDSTGWNAPLTSPPSITSSPSSAHRPPVLPPG